MGSNVPPRYVIVSQTSLPPDENHNRATTLLHPQIHYQYEDDPPTTIPMSLPSDAEIIYMDFNPNDPGLTQVRSASHNIIATGLTVSDAVGALPIENPNLYVINTGELQVNNDHDVSDPALALRNYRERLDTARRILEQDKTTSETDTLHPDIVKVSVDR